MKGKRRFLCTKCEERCPEPLMDIYNVCCNRLEKFKRVYWEEVTLGGGSDLSPDEYEEDRLELAYELAAAWAACRKAIGRTTYVDLQTS
jgi:hypothetical protein